MATKSRVRQVQELRRSSAAAPHTPRHRKGTRGARKARDMKEQES